MISAESLSARRPLLALAFKRKLNVLQKRLPKIRHQRWPRVVFNIEFTEAARWRLWWILKRETIRWIFLEDNKSRKTFFYPAFKWSCLTINEQIVWQRWYLSLMVMVIFFFQRGYIDKNDHQPYSPACSGALLIWNSMKFIETSDMTILMHTEERFDERIVLEDGKARGKLYLI